MAQPRPQLLSSMCRQCRQTYTKHARRALTTTSSAQDSDRPRSSLQRRMGIRPAEPARPPLDPAKLYADKLAPRTTNPPTSTSNSFSMREDLAKIADKLPSSEATTSSSQTSSSARNASSPSSSLSPTPTTTIFADEPYHLTIYAHKHNTHLTFTEPSSNPILSLSAGSLGLRRAQRSSYDAAFQLCAYFFRKMAEKQWKLGGSKNPFANKNPWCTLADVKRPLRGSASGAGIEVVLRGFGPGREAFQKALLGTEGRMVKPLVARVTDATRLKFGGTRSPQVRRL